MRDCDKENDGERKLHHCMTVDLEDWYHCYPVEQWDSMPSRLEEPSYWLLDEFEKRNIKSTFFILGYIAERHKELVRRIAAAGHEIGIHSYDHGLVFKKTPDEFARDTIKALDVVESIIGYRPDIYRAPSFSITKEVPWVWKILRDSGIRRDSSLFAAARLDGGYEGIPGSNFRFNIEGGGEMTEYPVLPKTIGKLRIPYTGGGYFRLLPVSLCKHWMKKTSFPLIFYIHPRDFDPGLPVIRGLSLLRKLLVYHGLKTSRLKLSTLLNVVPFSSIKNSCEESVIDLYDLFR